MVVWYPKIIFPENLNQEQEKKGFIK